MRAMPSKRNSFFIIYDYTDIAMIAPINGDCIDYQQVYIKDQIDPYLFKNTI